ncbi:S9 family peptidase [Idiomarina sp. HP20-50]|uniref:S9 family peptidase n=1 Tax=Idiomarina sp. HP20-50 TaxID=3070813 RepID=UPI00294AEF5F|nr:S9 family peptidase [Idiomarina sp. HP20-50]MDV6317255.1 S9 family peptidase [Idiomarina sp. HP20-50]
MLLRAVGGMALAVWAADLDAREMTLMDTVTTQAIRSADLSPDGQFTAVIRTIPRTPYQDEDGSDYRELVLVNSAGEETTYLSKDKKFSRVSFGPQSEYLYFTAKDENDEYQELYRIPVHGGGVQSVFEFDGNIGSYAISDDGQQLAFLSSGAKNDDEEALAEKGFKAEIYEEDLTYTQVYHVTLNNDEAEAKAVTPADQHALSVKFHPNNQQLLVMTSPTPLIDDYYMSSQYQLFGLDGTVVKSFATEGKLGRAEFSPDGRYLAMIRAADYNDPSAGRLFVYDTREQEHRNVLPDYKGAVKDFTWRTDEELVWLGHRGTESEVQALTLKFLESRSLVELGEAIFTGLDGEAGKSDFVLTGHRPSHPNEAFEYTNGRLERLTNSNPWLENIEMPRQETMTYKARDGVELQGIVVYPNDYEEGKRYPLMMVIHGGPESHYSNGWLDRYASPVKHSAAEGYALFFPNYRGSTGRGVEFSKMGQNDYAGKEFDDIVDAKKHLVDIGLADDARVGITGGSYGGYASAWGATAQTEHFAASVMFVGISDNLSKFGTTDIPKEMHAVHARSYPWDKWQWYLERSPIYHAEKARTPILIMHGKEDTRVHPSQSMELYRYLKTHGKVPVRLVLYPGEGHGNRKVAAQLDYSMRLMRWMDTFLVEKAEKKPPFELPHAEKLK